MQHPQVNLDIICEDVRYVSGQGNVMQIFQPWDGSSSYLEGLVNCMGTAIIPSADAKSVCMTYQTDSWGYLERTSSAPPADKPCTCS
jgi:hypothetical protein